ncbi:MAG TPA: hypothetical protein VID74_02195 [Gemmatimonadales bacterium]
MMASMVIGLTAGFAAWLAAGMWPSVTSNFVRLDQLSALALGAAVGAGVLGGREFRQRRSMAPGAAAGLVLGGAGGISGISLVAFSHGVVAPRTFLLERMAGWGLAAGFTVLALAVFTGMRTWRVSIERITIGIVGGAIAGSIFALPGITELWQAVAFLWFGASTGLAMAGPELWSATAVVESLPPRGRQLTLLALHEWPLYAGSLTLGEAQVAVVDGGVALYPPAGGVVADGHQVRRPRYLRGTTDLTIGRTRYRIRVLEEPR